MAEQTLTLQEQLLLLCLDDHSGRPHVPYLRIALAGAALAELLRRRRVVLDESRIRVRQTDPIGDPVIDEAFCRFSVFGRPRRLSWWVQTFYTGDRPIQMLADRLVERGILARHEHRALWVFQWHTYPVLEPAHGKRLRRQIREAVMHEGSVPAELATLISLLYSARALKVVLDAAEIAEREQRIAAICASYPIPYEVGKAVSGAVREIETLRKQTNQVIIIGPGPCPPRRRKPRRPWENTFPGPPPENNEPWTATQ
jgi:hypothetical protein